jgi:polyisoprenoid-binding protein YceI
LRIARSVFALSVVLAVAAAHAEAANYAIDPMHTFVTFEIGHFGTSTNRVRFDKNSGSITFDRAGKSGKVDISVDVRSVNSGTDAFNRHLQSSDMFDASKFPTLKFVGDKFSFDGDKVSEVAGSLTLLGKSLPVAFKATQFNCYMNPMLRRETCGGDFEATIDRTQWGYNYGVDWGFPKDVRLLVQVEAIKQ